MLSNTDVPELLARQVELETGILFRAFRRAARSAFLWTEKVCGLGTDRWAVEHGWVSITPLRLDLTDEADLAHPLALSDTPAAEVSRKARRSAPVRERRQTARKIKLWPPACGRSSSAVIYDTERRPTAPWLQGLNRQTATCRKLSLAQERNFSIKSRSAEGTRPNAWFESYARVAVPADA